MKTWSTKYNKWKTVLKTISLYFIKLEIVKYELVEPYPINYYKVNRRYKLEIKS